MIFQRIYKKTRVPIYNSIEGGVCKLIINAPIISHRIELPYKSIAGNIYKGRYFPINWSRTVSDLHLTF